MRKYYWIIFVVLMIGGLTVSVSANNVVAEEQLVAQLPEEAQELMEQIDLETSLSDGMKQIVESAAKQADGYLRSGLRQSGQMLAIALLCGILSCFENTRMIKIVSIAGVLAVAALGVAGIRELEQSGGSALEQLCTYSDTLLPAMAMATASTGCVNASSALYMGTVFFVSFLENLILRILQPMVYVYLALSCAEAAAQDDALKSLRVLIGWVIATCLKTVLFVFTVYLTVTGAISGSADATTVKAAKMTLSGVVPVVGSMISDASETLLVSASILRNTIGVFGMLAVLGICVLPFLQAGIRYLLLKATSAVAELMGCGAISKLIGALSTVSGYLLAMTGTCALMLIISFVCYIRVVI